MAGVKGRSKACRTCLRRKKGCGQQRPSCEQCLKARIPCGGYATELIFIQHSPKDRSDRSLPHVGFPKLKAAEAPQPSASSRTTARPHSRRPTPGQLSSSRIQESLRQASVGSLCRAQEEVKICGLFWDVYLPNGRALPLDITRDNMGGWINTVQDLHTTEPVLRRAMLALAMTTVGKMQDDYALLREGAEFYGKALAELSKALKALSNTYGNALLPAIRLFGLYELLHGMNDKQILPEASRSSWIAHIAGEYAYVSSQDPSMFATHHDHQLFVDGRWYLGTLALRGRVRTFLTTKPWMTEPWAVHKKTPRDLIIDIFLLLPGMFQDLDSTALYPLDAQDRLRAQLISRCIDLQDRLEQWHDLYAAKPQLATCEAERPTTVKAHDLAVAHLMSMYWAVALMCTTLLDSLIASLAGSSVQVPAIPPKRRKAFNADEICRNIVNVIPICLHPDAGLYRANLVGLQISAASLHMSIVPSTHMTAERSWLEQNLQRPECASINGLVWSLKCAGPELYNPMARPPDNLRFRLVPSANAAALDKAFESAALPEFVGSH